MKKPQKLPEEVVTLLLPRLKNEFEAFYFYRAASNWCRNVGFMMAADFFAKESSSELEHAQILEKFLVDWNIAPELPVINKPTNSFAGLPELIEAAYKIEYDLYEQYEDTSAKLFKIDICAFDLLQQFRTIQKDSVAEYSDMINILDGVDVKDKFKLLELQDELFA